MILFYFLERVWALITLPFARRNSLVPYTDRLRELIAADVDDLRRYGAYYPATEYGDLAGRASEALRSALHRSGIRDVTLEHWAEVRDAFGEGAITGSVTADPAWLDKLRRLDEVAARMARGV